MGFERCRVGKHSEGKAVPRSQHWWWAGGGIAVIAAAALAVGLNGGRISQAGVGPSRLAPPLPLGPLAALGTLKSPGSPGPTGPEGVPVPSGPALAPTMTTGQSIDGIPCSTGEQVAFHIHAHLTIFVNGVVQEVPAGLGIANPQAQITPQGPFAVGGSCFYWLHTHAADGIIHIEAPVTSTYHLGEFFDIWAQPLGPSVVGPASGPVTAFYNGQHWTGDPRIIPLNARAQIQLDIGRPLVAPQSIRFPNGL
jgi:hypothetical protein